MAVIKKTIVEGLHAISTRIEMIEGEEKKGAGPSRIVIEDNGKSGDLTRIKVGVESSMYGEPDYNRGGYLELAGAGESKSTLRLLHRALTEYLGM